MLLLIPYIGFREIDLPHKISLTVHERLFLGPTRKISYFVPKRKVANRKQHVVTHARQHDCPFFVDMFQGIADVKSKQNLNTVH